MENVSNKTSPRDAASWLSIMFFWWMNDVLTLGSKRPLTDEDLFPLLDDYKAEVLVEKAQQCWLDELERSQMKNTKPHLWKVVFGLIPWGSRFAIIILLMLRSVSFACLPLCLWLVLKTLNDGANMDMKWAFIHVAFLGMTSVIQGASTQHYNYATELWGLKLKVALIGLVYKKVIQLVRGYRSRYLIPFVLCRTQSKATTVSLYLFLFCAACRASSHMGCTY